MEKVFEAFFYYEEIFPNYLPFNNDHVIPCLCFSTETVESLHHASEFATIGDPLDSWRIVEMAVWHLMQVAVPGIVVVLVLLYVDAAVDSRLRGSGSEDPAVRAGSREG